VPNILQPGCYYHVVGTYDGNDMRLYLNGTEVGVLNVPGLIAIDGLDTGVNLSSSGEPLNGVLDEVRIYDRALTLPEIQAVYNSGGPEKCGPPSLVSQVELTGPVKVGGGFISGALILTALDGGGDPTVVSQDTVFSLSSNSSGITAFYADSDGTTPISQVTILSGQSYATLYYMDQALGSPLVTATWASGGSNLGQDSHSLEVWPVVGQIAFQTDRDGNNEIYIMNSDGSVQTRLTNNPAEDQFPDWSSLGSKIAFTSDRDGNDEIYIMNADGSGQTRLTDNPAWDGTPCFSPDGSKIAFVSGRDENFEIYVMNADGTGKTNLVNNPAADMHPSWSPDGSKIVFHTERDGNYEIYVMNADGSGQTRLSNNPALDGAPCWSPDGSKIAFMSDRDGDAEIYTMNGDGSSQERVTNNMSPDLYPSWSPDSSRIVFYTGPGGDGEINIINVDGTEELQLTDNSAADSKPSWGGAKIALHSDQGVGDMEIFIMNPDGSGITQISYNSGNDYSPKWSPSGDKLAFTSNTSGNYEIYTMNSDGSGLTNITNESLGDEDPSWSPDGSKIVFKSSRDGGPFEIYVMDAGGTNPIRLTINSAQDGTPVWSPYGTKIAYVSYSSGPGTYDIFTMDPDGDNQIAISDSTDLFTDRHPAWSPDGSKIAFGTNQDSDWNVYVMNVDGSDRTALTTDPAEDGSPAWSPDGRKVVFYSTRDGNWELYSVYADGTNLTRITDNSFVDARPHWRPQPTLLTSISPLVILTESIPYGVVGQAYSAQLAATGGIPPYEWSFSQFSLETEWLGLTLNPTTGEITGSPDTWQSGGRHIYLKDSSVPPLEATAQFPYVFDRPFNLGPLPNTSFESGTGGSADGWIIEPGSCGMTVERDETTGYSGTSSMKFACPSGCTGPCEPYIYTQDFVQLDEYKLCYIHFKARYTGDISPSEKVTIYVEKYTVDEEPISGMFQSYWLTNYSADEWFELIFPCAFDQNDFPLKIKMGIKREIQSGETSNATVWFDDLELKAYHGPLAQFVTPPANTEQGQVITPAVQVKAVDYLGEGVPGVEITLESRLGPGTLQGTTAVTTDPTGIATFDNIWLDDVGTYSLRATGWQSSEDSVEFEIEAAVVDQFTKILTGDIVEDVGYSTGCAWGDYDGDGDLDIFVANYLDDYYLYSNNGDTTFTKETSSAVVEGDGDTWGSAWGDYDNDGDLDLFVSNYYQNNSLYANNGNGTFTKVTSGAVVEDVEYSYCCAWGDYDNDGNLDLFVTNIDQNNSLYTNNGNGTFTKVTSGAVVSDGGDSRGCAWGDYDNNGDLDLFVSNWGHENNFLYTNNGDGSFTKVTSGAVVSDAGYSRSCGWGDYDNDGDLDLFVPNASNDDNFLYTNNGNGTFTKETSGILVEDGGESYGCSWGDYDNDGDLDLFVSNYGFANFFYSNDGDGSFTKVTSGAVVGNDESSRGCASGDYDNDGDLDLFVANYHNQNNFLYANNGNSNNWVNISCEGTVSNVAGIGTKVKMLATIAGNPVWQLREISGGMGESQNSLNAEFGLGDASVIDEIQVLWPSGQTQILSTITPNQLLTIVEPSLPAPAVASMNPTTGTIADDTLNVTILGSNFYNGATAELNFDGSDTINATSVIYVNGTELQCVFDLTGVLNHLGESWDLKVTNPGGPAGVHEDIFFIYLPDPTVSYIVPDTGTTGGSYPVAISGTNFTGGAVVKLTKTGEPDIDASGVSADSDTQISCTFDLTGAAVGAWNVVVTIPEAENPTTLTNGFTVTAPAPPTATQLIFTTQPGGGAADRAWAQQPVIKVQDIGGNTITSDNTTEVTLAIGSNPGGGELAGHTTLTVINCH
jgi:Tol biopolymer transport system component